MRKTIKNKLRIIIVISVLALAIISSFFVYFDVKYNLSNDDKSNLNNVVSETGCHLSQLLSFSSNLVKTISKQKEIISFLENNPKNLDNTLSPLLKRYDINNNYLNIYIMNTEGTTISSIDPSFIGKNYNFHFYFKKAISNRLGMDIVLGSTSNKLGYYFSYPIRSSSGYIIGVAVIKLKPEIINKSIAIENKRFKHIFLTDKFGVIIFSDDIKNIYKSIGDLNKVQLDSIKEKKRFGNNIIKSLGYNSIQKAINRHEEQKIINNLDEDRKSSVMIMHRVCNTSFYLVIEDQSREYINIAFDISSTIGAFIVSIALLLIIVLFISLNFFLKPIDDLLNWFRELANNNYFIKLKKNRRSVEFEELSSLANIIVKNIKKIKKDVDVKFIEQNNEIKRDKKRLNRQRKAILNVLEDVEKKRDKALQEEEKIKTILYNIGDAVFVIDNKRKITFLNKAVKKLDKSLQESKFKVSNINYNHNDQMVIDNVYYNTFAFYTDEDRTKKDNFIEKAIITGKIVTNSNKGILVIKNKKVIPIIATAAPWFNSEKKVKGCIIVFHDVHKEREIDKAKTEFVSLASHQLRAPLATVNWYAESLLEGDAGTLNTNQSEYIKEIYHGNNKMISMINSLLNVSRLDLGTFIVSPKLTDLVKLCKNVIKEFKSQIQKRNLKLKIISKDKKFLLKVDNNLMRIIFQNLLSNAIKYSSVGSDIIVKMKFSNENAIIEVSDKGLGIAEEEYKKIFTKLFRGTNVKKAETEGTGLGLYTVKSILNASGGQISFVSKLGRGTTFIIKIPKTGMKARIGKKKLVN